jgi:hypothetical protein
MNNNILTGGNTMKWCVAFTLLVLCSSCTPTGKSVVVPGMRPIQVRTFAGTYYTGEGSENPKLASSQYLITHSAGLRLTVNGAACYIDVDVLKDIPQGYYIKVEYPNPANPQAPYFGGIVFNAGNKGFSFSSPNGMKGLEIGKEYNIKVTVLKTKDSVGAVDVLEQKFRSYLDTTGNQTKAPLKFLK